MTKKWHRFRNPWDREYAKRGVLWRGQEDLGWVADWIPPGTSLVDLGCGDGKFLSGLQRLGYRAVGLDFSPKGLRLAATRGPAAALLGDVCALPFKTAHVSAFTARFVMGALRESDRLRAAAEWVRALHPGGLLLVEEFTPEDFRFGKGREVEARTYERDAGITLHYFERGELGALFPTCEPVRQELVAFEQRTLGGARPRRRWRLLMRKKG